MFGSILVFLIVLSILVLVHELGHFIVARKTGVWVEEFGFGLPPRIFGKKIGETIYSINLFPFGGFVRLHGESDDQAIAQPKRAFLNKSKKTRTAIVIAGVVMNFFLAIFAFAVVYSFAGIPKDTREVKVVDVSSSSPAQISGIIPGDVVKKVDGHGVFSVKEFVDLIEKRKGVKVELTIEKELKGEKTTKKVLTTPRENPPENEGPLGVTITTIQIYYPPLVQRPFIGVYYGVKEAMFWGKSVVLGFTRLIIEAFEGNVPKDLAGPVGIFAITSQAAKLGILALVNFVGILSVNLAVLNIIPFPALDGGRLLFIGIEGLFGRRIVPKVEAAVHTIGMIILLVLLLAITANDIQRLISSGGISGFIDGVLK